MKDSELGISKIPSSRLNSILGLPLRWVSFDYKSFSFRRASAGQILEAVEQMEDSSEVIIKERFKGEYIIKISPTFWFETRTGEYI